MSAMNDSANEERTYHTGMTDRELSAVLAERVAGVRSRIAAACARVGRNPEGVTLVAVTKTVSPRVSRLIAELGVLDLGESRPQELWRKVEAIKDLPICWHLVGHLQRNKVEQSLPLVHLVHSVDSLRLLQAIANASSRIGYCPPILLQVNASREDQKHGFDFEELIHDVPKIVATSAELDIAGLMGMAALTDNPEQARSTFRELLEFRDRLRAEPWLRDQRPLPHLSMGMSGDFEVAIEEGATIVRIGTTLFEGLENE
jgi:pyridoxal phosphate enzyme (YggS family)